MTVCAEARVRKERVARKCIAVNDPRIIVSCSVGWAITETVAGKNRHSQVFFNKASSSVSIAEVVWKAPRNTRPRPASYENGLWCPTAQTSDQPTLSSVTGVGRPCSGDGCVLGQ